MRKLLNQVSQGRPQAHGSPVQNSLSILTQFGNNLAILAARQRGRAPFQVRRFYAGQNRLVFCQPVDVAAKAVSGPMSYVTALRFLCTIEQPVAPTTA